jgi:hypothetical protein
VATTAFETDKAGESVCKFYKQRAMSTGPCYAKRFQIEGGEDFTHVHFEQHNHDLCNEVSQDTVEAIKAAAKDPEADSVGFHPEPGQTGNPAKDGRCRSDGGRPGFRRVSKHVETKNLI